MVPKYSKNLPEFVDPVVAIPLKEKGLLHILEAETIVDKEATEKLATAMTEVVTSGVLDPLAKENTAFHELSYSRLGGYGDPGLARMIFEELLFQARALSRTR